ncbi:MAG: 50S ribosomal protein L9 [Oscillospiraceae bacterium]|jgi:large subunit ribosomal protein L9|nr:50S ribosomal protein L9 [Oscillospiraceae bacterium]
MEVLFTKVCENYEIGDVANVKSGYARYLFRNGVAVKNTENLKKQVECKKSSFEWHREVEKQNALELAAKIDGKIFEVLAKTGKSGKLFGAITTKDIALAVSDKIGRELDKKMIHLEEEIKSVGTFLCTVKLFSGISTNIHVNVVADESESE